METTDIASMTYDHFKDGRQVRRQLEAKVLSNTGLWADVAFLHQDRDRGDGWKPARVTIARFKRTPEGFWRKQSHFNVNAPGRADRIMAVLSEWRERIGDGQQGEEEAD